MNILDKIKIKQCKNSFTPYTLSIYKLCESEGQPERFIQIKNRILWELEQNAELEEYVYLDMKEGYVDFLLTDDGMFIFSEILMSYFDDKLILDIYRNVRDKNKILKLDYDIKTQLKSLDKNTLKQYKNEYASKGDEISARCIQEIQQELNRRRIFKKPIKSV